MVNITASSTPKWRSRGSDIKGLSWVAGATSMVPGGLQARSESGSAELSGPQESGRSCLGGELRESPRPAVRAARPVAWPRGWDGATVRWACTNGLPLKLSGPASHPSFHLRASVRRHRSRLIPSYFGRSDRGAQRLPWLLRSDDTDARREARRCFGRSERSAQQQHRFSRPARGIAPMPGYKPDPPVLPHSSPERICLPNSPI
jgi:hypothetical protein